MNTFLMIIALFVLIALTTVISYNAGLNSIKKNIGVKLVESEETICLLTSNQQKHPEKCFAWNLYREMIDDQRKISNVLREILPPQS